jgi:acyl-CoA thioester hydrolase
MKFFSIKQSVLKKHLDDLNHVNNIQYLCWVQEAAKLHWEYLVGEDINEFHFWVVRSHQIEYKYAAKFGDNLLIKTYVTKTNTFLSERIVEIILEPDEKIITRCITKWCYVNRESGKLEKIPKKIKDLLQSKD